MSRAFVYSGLPARVVFGAGTLATAGAEVERLGIRRALVLTTAAQQEHGAALVAQLGDRAAGLFAGAVMHTPVDVTQQALARLHELGADGVVELGGGSTIGLGKALAVRTGVAQVAIPTTYADRARPVLPSTGRWRTAPTSRTARPASRCMSSASCATSRARRSQAPRSTCGMRAAMASTTRSGRVTRWPARRRARRRDGADPRPPLLMLPTRTLLGIATRLRAIDKQL